MTTQQTPQKRRITVIPPNPQLTERDIHKKHLRVAPYCRVSTDSEEQLNSYNAQIAYYTEKIAATPEWTMVRLYADEGITGTSMKRRKEFLKMLRDCDRGKIDLIITKSVSRFGRNTLDGLDTVRKLKRKGIGVFFEKENTNTLYMDNEMILTFMMSQAQAESESLSGSVKWGHRKNFKDGKVYYHYASFLGYRKGPDGLPEIDPDEAAIVRRIFARYLLGQSVHQICRDLMSDGVKTAQGSDSWHDSVVRKMLQN
ncbi:recombinase family protein, partial [uncultured Oscillibacter sp.]